MICMHQGLKTLDNDSRYYQSFINNYLNDLTKEGHKGETSYSTDPLDFDSDDDMGLFGSNDILAVDLTTRDTAFFRMRVLDLRRFFFYGNDFFSLGLFVSYFYRKEKTSWENI